MGSGVIVHDAVMVFEKKVRQKDCKFKASLCYTQFEEICLTNKMKQHKTRKKGEKTQSNTV